MENHINIISLGGADVLIIAITVWFLGTFLTNRVAFLKKYSIPAAVSGGLICSSVVTIVFLAFDLQINFDMRLRDLLLLIFFSTIGLSAKLRLLAAGGKALVTLLVISAVFLVFQNLTGVLLALAMDAKPAYGLFGGSVSLAGGHGTAIAWGIEAEQAGLVGASDIGLAFATFGLIVGGLAGGPIGQWLIKRNNLTGPILESDQNLSPSNEGIHKATPMSDLLGTVLLLAVCVEAGDLVNRALFSNGVALPGFLTAMMVGIFLTNVADLLKFKLNDTVIGGASEISLQLFLAMSLMSMQLWTIASTIGPIMIVIAFQLTLMTFFTVWVVYRAMGRDYDACVIASGFVGLGMGATPVGIANMNALTSKYGPSPKAFLVVPLVGAFFIDLTNALVIKFFIGLPFMS